MGKKAEKDMLAHRYLDVKWEDIKRFLQLVHERYPLSLYFVKKELEKKERTDLMD